MSRRGWLAVALWVLPSLVAVSVAALVAGRYRITPPPPLDGAARAAVMEVLGQALRGQAAGASEPRAAAERAAEEIDDLARPLDQRGPMVVSVWLGGRAQARVLAYGDTVGGALRAAVEALASDAGVAALSAAERAEARIKVDLVVARGPLVEWGELARALGFHPGIDGFAATLTTPSGDTRELLLTPDELFLHRLFGSYRPLDYIPEFTIGFDFERADMMLAKHAQLGSGVYGQSERHYARFRADSFVERPRAQRDQGPPLPLTRGLPPAPPVTAETLRAAALAGGRYLVAHLADNGRYVYERDLTTGHGTDPHQRGAYSIPRHAGTTYFLAELYRLTGEDWLREPIERAFAHLEELIRAGGCRGATATGERFACVVDQGDREAHLGSTALTVVALAEYQRATDDDRYQPLARQLSAWLLDMQRPDGSFHHLYDLDSGRKDPDEQLFYYAGESALALARMHVVTGEVVYRDAAERALDHLIGWYDFFAGGFFYGEEHWTCIAAEALYPAVERDRYRRFCNGYGAFLRRQQPAEGEFIDQSDYAGSYNVTPYLIPQNTPAGSRTESMISAYLLGVHQGAPEPALRAQILAALQYTLGQQLRDDGTFAVSGEIVSVGAVPGTPVDRAVRIDFVQHVCSAMIRAAVMLEAEDR